MNKRLRNAVIKAGELYNPTYLTDGNFTACILWHDDGIISFGFSKRNPNCDEMNAERGNDIAYIRAVKRLMLQPKKKKAKK